MRFSTLALALSLGLFLWVALIRLGQAVIPAVLRALS